jgi:glycosyltransferase involved in cell wall biosynthesis
MKIALFFTEQMSLRAWQQAGLVKRDSLLYEQLCAAGHEVYFVSYGGPDDASYLPPGSPIHVLTRPEGMGHREYSWGIWRIHGEALRGVEVIKAHQVIGARYAVYAKWRLGKKYIARCGYLPSYFMAQEGANRGARWRIAAEEALSFHAADVICVPSQAEIDYLHSRYRINKNKALACPNWVDTDFFRPDPQAEKHPRRLCFVGRFHPQKDPLSLLEALRGIPDIELLMIGGGPLRLPIEAAIAEYGLNVRLLDRVPNEDLPGYYNSAALYVLPTRYEGGSPKTLFEAMACGLPVVSTDGFGVNEAFEHGQQGYKVKVGDVAGLRAAILGLLDHPGEAAAMGARARAHVLAHYSAERALVRELALLENL